MITVSSIQEWLADSGLDQQNGARINVTRYQGGCFCLTVARLGSKCERCATRGPSALTRLLGSCGACVEIVNAEQIDVRILVNKLVPLLREDFEFQDDEALRSSHTYIHDGIHDNGVVVRIYLKGVINR